VLTRELDELDDELGGELDDEHATARHVTRATGATGANIRTVLIFVSSVPFVGPLPLAPNSPLALPVLLLSFFYWFTMIPAREDVFTSGRAAPASYVVPPTE